MRRLYSRIYLHLLGVLLVVGLAASVIVAVGQRGAFQRQVVERVARHVGALVAESIDDRPALARRVAQLHADLDVGVTVRDAEGRVLVTAGPELRVLEPGEVARLREGTLITEARPAWFLAAAVRHPVSGTLLGFLEVSTPPRMRAPSLWRPAIAVLSVLALVAVAAVPLARRISRPVERLTDAARRLGAGDLTARVPLASLPHEPPPGSGTRRAWRRRAHPARDELAELTVAFNDMAERLERLVRGQKELLANVSHELRSPLARVRVALALVPRGAGAEARLQDVEADLAELERLIDDVLTSSRLDATGVPPTPGPVDVRRLLAELVERARHDPGIGGQLVQAGDGPPLGIVADGALLKRALWNLVENAAKYGAPPIVLAATRVGARVRLTVEDRGPGIAPADRERVLAPFYRGDHARTPSAAGEPPRGFGLGLTLARRVAEAHGGTLTIGPAAVVDDTERGCRVTLELPAAVDASPS